MALSLDFQMELSSIIEGKSDGITSKSGEHLGEASAAHSCGFATENLADVSSITSRRTSQRAVLKSAAATGTTAMLATSLLEPSSPQPGSRLSRSRDSQGSRPQGCPPAREACSVSLPAVTHTSLCAVWTPPFLQQLWV